MTEPKQYALRTVADFAAIPADRIDACMIDFASWLRLCHKSAEVTKAAATALGADVSFDEGGFTWLDDGIVGINQIDIMCDDVKIATWPIRRPA